MRNQRHYFLKLTEGFFQNEKIIILENNKNGMLFSNILLKLYLLSMKNEGELLFSEKAPYTSEMLARLTGHKITIVEQALTQFKQLNLFEELENGTLNMVHYNEFVGSITSEGERKRAYRNKQKEEGMQPYHGTMSHECPTYVPDLSQSYHEIVPEISQSCHEDVPQKGEDCPTDVPDLSLTCHDVVTQIDKEVTYIPRPLIEIGENSEDNDVPIFKKPKKLKLPKKNTTTATAQTTAPNENEDKTPITHEEGEESMK